MSGRSVPLPFIVPPESRFLTLLPARTNAARRYFRRTRSNASYCDMSERITWSPSFKPRLHFHRVHRRLADRDLRPHERHAVAAEPEEADDALLLAVGGPADVEDVVEPLELDRAVHAQVRPRALRQFALQRDVHGHGAVLHGRVDARHAAGDDPVARVDRRRLADHDVLRLRLRDLQLRLQVPLVGHAGEVGAGPDLLADLAPAPAAACR